MQLYRILKISKTENTYRIVCLLPMGQVGKMIQDMGIEVISLNFKRKIPSFSGFLKLIYIINAFQPDIIQTWLYHADLAGFLAAKCSRVNSKIVWNIRCSDMQLSGTGKTTLAVVWLCSFLSKKVDGIITNSYTARKFHIKTFKYQNKRFQVIPNGFDPKVFYPDKGLRDAVRKEFDIHQDDICVAMINRYDPIKGHKVFLKAADKVVRTLKKSKNNLSIKFVMAGHGIVKDNLVLSGDIDIYGLTDHVKLLDQRNDINAVLNCCDMACSASLGEGFSNIVAEAMLAGLPCVVTHVGDSALIVKDTGLVVPSGNAKELAHALVRLVIMDKAKREAMGLKARKRIMDHFMIDKINQRYASFYETLGEC
jgi:glycosyltransferase involved in cell wall biosynthesis